MSGGRPQAPANPVAPGPAGHRLGLPVLVLGLLALAWSCRFVQDDAFISFRYARNLVEGHGLVFNPGEPVEGYTNFLWTLLVAGGLALGLDPVPVALGLGLAAHALTLLATARLAHRILPGPADALLAVGLVGTLPSVAAWATGGLETSLDTALATVGLALAAGEGGRARAPLASLVAGLAVLNRPDGALLAGVVLGSLALEPPDRGGGPGPFRRGAALVLPAAALVLPWLAFKLRVYGTLVPNTFHAKAAGSDWGLGLAWVGLFLASSLWLVLVPVLLRALPTLVAAGPPGSGALVLYPVLRLAYLARVGGDFMEFRLLVPALPALGVALVWLARAWAVRPLVRHGIPFLVLAGSLHHASTFAHSPLRLGRPETVRGLAGQEVVTYPEWSGIETVAELAAHLSDPAQDWTGVGRALARLGAPPDLRVAGTAIGALGWESRLRILDMHGLTDPEVARTAPLASRRVGHRRLASLEFLVRRGVHLVVGHPRVLPPGQPVPPAFSRARLGALRIVSDGTPMPPAATMVAIPLDGGGTLLALALAPHPALARARQELGWRPLAWAP